MRILAIESSCDETSAAVVEKKEGIISVLSNVTATSLSIHAKTGGIIPENAAREQVKYIIPVIAEALLRSVAGDAKRGTPTERTQMKSSTSGGGAKRQDPLDWEVAREVLEYNIDKIAVTHGPGLIGSLLVGVETAKTFSFVLNKPLIPVNHLLAHLFANFIDRRDVSFPFIGLIVSGGHTDLLLFESVSKSTWLGGTRDDAAGEALDKIGRLSGLSYPAGAEIEKRAALGKDTKLRFKSPLLGEDSFDFSFSGLKTEVMRHVQDKKLTDDEINSVCFAVQKAVIDVLVKKTLKAAEKYNCKTILLGGGVSANQTLVSELVRRANIEKQNLQIFSPEKIYCTDNAAMIGAYALLNPTEMPWKKVNASPELYFT